MSKQAEYQGVQVTPSQLKTIEALRQQVLDFHGEGFEFKRFEVYPFASAKILEVLIEVGKTNETPVEAITERTLRQIYVGERGGCELANPSDPEKRNKIKGLRECVSAETAQ